MVICFRRHVDGETRVGVFAARSIEAGEPLTYDYRYDPCFLLLCFWFHLLNVIYFSDRHAYNNIIGYN